jgi:hypothetical protein
MTNAKTIILIIAILEIALCVIGYAYMQNNIKNFGNEAQVYSVRKEELVTQQRQLEAVILDLNKTLQSEISKEKVLENQLSSLTGKPSSTQNGVSTPPAAPQQPAAPTPKVTRAS